MWIHIRTYYEELRDLQFKNGLLPLFPFASPDEFELIKYIHKSRFTVDDIERLLAEKFVSASTNSIR